MTQPHDPNQPPSAGQWQQYPQQQWQQPYPTQYPPPYGYGYPQPPKPSGMSIAGMVLGITSLALCFLPIGFLPLITAIVGLPLAIIGGNQDRRSGTKTGMATAGIVCSAIALLLGILAIAFWNSSNYL